MLSNKAPYRHDNDHVSSKFLRINRDATKYDIDATKEVTKHAR